MQPFCPDYTYYSLSERCRDDVYIKLRQMRKSLSELRLHSEKSEKVQELEDLCQKQQERLQNMEELQRESEMKIQELNQKLRLKKKEIEELRSENVMLRSKSLPNGICQNGDITWHVHTENHKLSKVFPTKDRSLQRILEAEKRAQKAEERADYLNVLLAEKVIQMNKIQLTLSDQTKNLIELEKAFFQHSSAHHRPHHALNVLKR